MGRLFWKVLLGFWLALLAAGTIVAIVVFTVQQTESDDELLGRADGPGLLLRSPWVSDRLLRHAEILRHAGEPALRDYMHRAHERRMARGRTPVVVLVVDARGRDLLGRPVPASALELARRVALTVEEDAAETPAVALRVSADAGGEYLLFMPRPPEWGRGRPEPPFWARLPTSALLTAGLAFSLLFSAALAWYLARPIRALRAGLRRVAGGDLGTRVAPVIGRRRDELADLGRDLDRTTERLQRLIESQRRLLHDVSHELRSPLARMQAAMGILRQTPARADSMIERLEHETRRLDELVGEILTLARLDEDPGSVAPETIDLRDLIADVVADASFEAQQRQVSVAFADGPAAAFDGRPTLLLRAVENLLRNAVRHSRPGAVVEVALDADGEHWRIDVTDRGPGIEPARLQKVLEPFVRGGADDGEGFGLGLAIAQRAVQIHGGRLELANREGGGLVATIRLPRSGPDAPRP